jgi:uncharacterized protein (DUF697 family)
MSRKKLPRAITRSTGELLEAGAGASERRITKKPRHRTSKALPNGQPAESGSPTKSAKVETAHPARFSKTSKRDGPSQPPSPPAVTKMERAPRRSTSKISKAVEPATSQSAPVDDGTQAESPARARALRVSSPDQTATPESTSPHDPASVETSRETTSSPIEGEILPPALSIHSAQPHAPNRRAVAEKVVDRYKLYAAMGGLSPIPIVTAAGVTIAILQMVKTLSNLYGVPFERDITKSIIVGLIGGAVPTGLGVATASALALAIPSVGFVGIAVSVLTAAELTGRIGLIFVDRFESGAMPPTVGTSDP